MRIKRPTLVLLALAGLVSVVQIGCQRETEWISLFDGQTLEGWRASENASSVSVVDGQIVCNGERSHLFYVGEVNGGTFNNFEFKADVKASQGANSGIYFHTAYQDEGWPSKGYEVQINNSQAGDEGYRELKKTASLYGVRNMYKQLVGDDEWFTMNITVRGNHIVTKINDQVIVDYYEETPLQRTEGDGRRLSSGTFALQCHDPGSVVAFKNIAVRPLPDDVEDVPADVPEPDERYAQVLELGSSNFPLVDFHVHLKGGLSLEEALEWSRKSGFNIGLAPNCGLGFPIQDDEGIYAYLDSLKGQPVFVGMQAEGREWVNLFSPEAVAQFDYVFSDAMTFTDNRGERVRLWINDEVSIDDEQAFMDMYVEKILGVITDEPIDIYVNPTFLPEVIRDRYDELWTETRMKKVVQALVDNEVALEINNRYRIPSLAFLKLAKESGVKFTCGTNNAGEDDFGDQGYCLDMIEALDLSWQDMFMPRPDSLKRIYRTPLQPV